MILSELRANAYKVGTIVFGALAVAGLIACLFLWGRGLRAAARADAAEQRAQQMQAQLQAIAEQRAEAEAANAALRAKLAKPAPGQTIREVVRNVPSDCRVDPAVSGSLREAVKRANQAAASK